MGRKEKRGEWRAVTVYVDADACPVTRIVEQVAQAFQVPVVLLCDTNHVLTSSYSEVQVIGAGTDAVDLALINRCRRGDVVVTQDYGVAALALGKGASSIHQSGRQYTDENIDGLLWERHAARKERQKGRHHLKGPSKRTPADDVRFRESFTQMLESRLSENNGESQAAAYRRGENTYEQSLSSSEYPEV